MPAAGSDAVGSASRVALASPATMCRTVCGSGRELGSRAVMAASNAGYGLGRSAGTSGWRASRPMTTSGPEPAKPGGR